jgi:hypothetical protein
MTDSLHNPDLTDTQHHLDLAAGWASEAVERMRPGHLVADTQKAIVKGQLEVLQAQITATKALVELVKQLENLAYPARTLKLMEDI